MTADMIMRDVFFEECEDLIAALTEGLTAMRDGSTDSETVNAVFRAVHSVKGAAGAFALDDLVGFAHTFETVLDHVRSQRLALDDRILHVLQRSGDILADLIETAREELPINPPPFDFCRNSNGRLRPSSPNQTDKVKTKTPFRNHRKIARP